MDHDRGLLAYIYKHDGGTSSNGGMSSRVDRVTVVGEGVPGIFAPTDDAPAVYLTENVRGHLCAYPTDNGDRWLMFGGTFVWTSDSRFPARHPVPLHDRHEG